MLPQCPSFPITAPKPLWIHLTPVNMESCGKPPGSLGTSPRFLRTQKVISKLTQCVDPEQVGKQRMSLPRMSMQRVPHFSRVLGARNGAFPHPLTISVLSWCVSGRAGLTLSLCDCGFRRRDGVVNVEELLDSGDLHRTPHPVGHAHQRQVATLLLMGHISADQRPDPGR